jgi:hypothetical protein
MRIAQAFTKHLSRVAVAIGLSAIAAAAQAQTLGQARPQTSAQTPTAASAPAPQAATIAAALRGVLGVSGQSTPLPLNFESDQAPLTPGVARTAVDHPFGKGGVVGSAGFLCGRGAGPDNNGAATAYGYDPEGRFVGAKLSFAFK